MFTEHYLFSFSLFFVAARGFDQDLTLARQALYHLSHSTSPRTLSVIAKNESNSMPISRSVDKQNVIYPNNRILLVHRKTYNSEICCTDET
jgi:hypothetical protein